MKVSIITYHRVYNYGAALQAYATQKCFKKMGIESEIIDYIPKKVKNYGSFSQVFYESGFFYQNFVKRMLTTLLKIPSYRRQKKVFEPFYNERLKMTKSYYSEAELKADLPDSDIFCTGSDQVWNNRYSNGFDRPFFLSFVENKPKIALSASFGKKSFSNEEMKTILPYLEEYKAISVREKSGLEIIKPLDNVYKENTLDPTLMIDKSEWSNFIEDVPFQNYILVYQLHGDSNCEEYAQAIAKERGLKVVKIITMLHKKSNTVTCVAFPSVQQFLSLINYAEMVVTDSFHGTAFSINFNKQFISIKPNKAGERIQSILEMTDLTSRMVDSAEEANTVAETPIDYAVVNEKMAVARQNSMDYLKKAIELCKE